MRYGLKDGGSCGGRSSAVRKSPLRHMMRMACGLFVAQAFLADLTYTDTERGNEVLGNAIAGT